MKILIRLSPFRSNSHYNTPFYSLRISYNHLYLFLILIPYSSLQLSFFLLIFLSFIYLYRQYRNMVFKQQQRQQKTAQARSRETLSNQRISSLQTRISLCIRRSPSDCSYTLHCKMPFLLCKTKHTLFCFRFISCMQASTISLCHKKIEKITPRNRNIYLLHAHCKYPVNK